MVIFRHKKTPSGPFGMSDGEQVRSHHTRCGEAVKISSRGSLPHGASGSIPERGRKGVSVPHPSTTRSGVDLVKEELSKLATSGKRNAHAPEHPRRLVIHAPSLSLARRIRSGRSGEGSSGLGQQPRSRRTRYLRTLPGLRLAFFSETMEGGPTGSTARRGRGRHRKWGE